MAWGGKKRFKKFGQRGKCRFCRAKVKVIDIAAAPNHHYMHQASINFVADTTATLAALQEGVAANETWTDGAIEVAKAKLAADFPALSWPSCCLKRKRDPSILSKATKRRRPSCEEPSRKPAPAAGSMPCGSKRPAVI